MRAFTSLVLALSVLAAGCDAPSGIEGRRRRIDSVTPVPVAPGEPIAVRGRGFGTLPLPDDGVWLAGRPLELLSWAPEDVSLRVPAHQPAGEALLTARTQGEWLAPVAVRVGGHGAWPGPDEDRDVGPFDARVPSPTVDLGPTLGDARLPDAVIEGAVAELTPDDRGAQGVWLESADSPAGELRLTVNASPDLWGVACHLVWDPNLLQLVSASPDVLEIGATTRASRALEGGRLALGGLVPPDGSAVFTLRFALVGTGEGRIDLPTRFASARGPGNLPVSAAQFRGGSVRVRNFEGAP